MKDIVINEVLARVLFFYIGQSITLIGVIALCIWGTITSSGAKSKNCGIMTITAIAVFLVILLTSVIPFVSDYLTDNVASAEGIYINNQSNAATDILGIYGVTFTYEDTEIHLTTAPLHSKEDFPRGTFNVTAYFTGESQILLFIDCSSNAE